MEKHAIEFCEEFLKFLNDPGTGVRNPLNESLILEDFFVFPKLMLSTAGIGEPGSSGAAIISSRELLRVESLSPLVFITGPADSGKTTLLKILMKYYAAAGLFPLYIDCSRIGSIDRNGQRELVSSAYEKQYTEKSLQQILSSSSDKKICLLDNIDSVRPDRQILHGLADEFGFSIVTTSIPLLGETFSSEFIQDKAPLNFELMEFSFDLRRELCSKWHNLPAKERERDTVSINAKIESALNIMDEVIGRDLAPSYPLILLTILNIGDSGDQELSQSSYGYYIEHLVTKPLKERAGADRLEALMVYLSQLANLMFTERKSSATALELAELFEKQSGTQNRAQEWLSTLIESGALGLKEAEYYFRYEYVYHYFAALYLARNIGLESVRDDVRRLCANLGDGEYANIMLLLTYLSDDPFILGEISGTLDTSAADTSPDSVDEQIREIDELIESIISTGEKDKKLRELRAEYTATRERVWTRPAQRRAEYRYEPLSDPEVLRKRLDNTQKELRLLDLAGGLLKKHLQARPLDPATLDLAGNLYRFWFRSLGATAQDLLKTRKQSSVDSAATYGRDKRTSTSTGEYMRQLERFSLAMNIFGLYVRHLTRALGSIAPSELFDREQGNIPKKSSTLFELCATLARGEEDAVFSEIESFSRATGTGKFARELVRKIALLRLCGSRSGTELESKLAELEQRLTR